MRLLSFTAVYANNNRRAGLSEIDLSHRKVTVIAQNIQSIDEAIESEDVPTAKSIVRFPTGQTFAATDDFDELVGRWERALL